MLIFTTNISKGLRSLKDLTKHLTTRADDSHATPVRCIYSHSVKSVFNLMSRAGKVLRVVSN